MERRRSLVCGLYLLTLWTIVSAEQGGGEGVLSLSSGTARNSLPLHLLDTCSCRCRRLWAGESHRVGQSSPHQEGTENAGEADGARRHEDSGGCVIHAVLSTAGSRAATASIILRLRRLQLHL